MNEYVDNDITIIMDDLCIYLNNNLNEKFKSKLAKDKIIIVSYRLKTNLSYGIRINLEDMTFILECGTSHLFSCSLINDYPKLIVEFLESWAEKEDKRLMRLWNGR